MRQVTLILAFIFCTPINANNEDPALADDAIWEDVPTVITATRFKQSMKDVPAASTVITSDMIQYLDIRLIPEALRLVPGMTVTYVAGNQAEVSYHATNIMAPRRMQVLVDDMSVYRTGKAEMDWSIIPVSMEDIAQIEVVRGPNSSSYGANSAVGIVKIITEHPQDAWGWKVKSRVGSNGVQDNFLRYGGAWGQHHYKLSMSQTVDDGFDLNRDRTERRDSTDITKINFRTVFDLTDKDDLDVTMGIVSGKNEVEFIDNSQTTFPDIDTDSQYFQGKWTHNFNDRHEIFVKAYSFNEERKQRWNSCLPQIMFTPELRAMNEANPAYAATILAGGLPSGGSNNDDVLAFDVFARVAALGGVQGALSPTCMSLNQDWSLTKEDIEIQDTYVFNENLRTIIGFGKTDSRVDSETFFGGQSPESTSNRLFSSLEYKRNKVNINIGVMIEDENTLSDNEISPRFALHYNINNNNVIKFVTSEAVRTPDIFELASNQRFLGRGLTPPVAGQTDALFYFSPPGDFAGLQPEKIVSNEIIWYGTFPDKGLTVDVKLFREDLDNLISEKLQFFDFVPSNNGEAEIEGIETEISYRPNNSFYGRITYSYQDLSANTPTESSFHTEHSGSILGSYQFDSGYILTSAYFANTGIRGFDYHRFDVSVSKTFGNFRTSLLYQHMPRNQGGVDRGFRSVAATNDFSNIIENDYKENHHLFLTIDYTY